MRFTATIQRFIQQFKETFFIYKDGFFEISYNAVSPQKMVDSFDSMPFNKHNTTTQTLSTNNPFLKGLLRYQKIEEGFWVNVANLKYKANVNFKPQYSTNDEPYFFLNFYVQTSKFEATKANVNGFEYENKSWALFKPKVAVDDIHHKGGDALFIVVYFTQKWFDKNLANELKNTNSKLTQFFANDHENYIIWPDSRKYAQDSGNAILHMFSDNPNQPLPSNLPLLKTKLLDFILDFNSVYAHDNISSHFYEISNADRKKIHFAEKLLVSKLLKPFIGVDALAKEVGLSPTKFKQLFKMTFGLSTYQYYQHKQMLLAKEMLNNNLKSGEVALLLGYENASKFSAAFKKHHNILP
ncbi:MAG: AraC family transcriptional regulator, partial [Bacteroidia bacterium]